MKHIFKDPFLQFIGLGVLLFIGHGLWEKSVAKSEATITVDAPVRARLAAVFETEQGRAPGDAELAAVIDGYVTEQALAREAMRAGLDEGDTIITRRLAQKMRFMLESNALSDAPGDDILRAWQEDNSDKFAVPAARAITHVYLSGSGDRLEAKAANVKVALTNNPDNWNGLGDPFMLQSQYGLLDETAMSRIFGRAFTEAVMALPGTGGSWQGPVESAFGLHFVRIDRARARQALSFDEARADVLKDWQNVKLDSQNKARIRAVIDRYAVDAK